MPWLPRRLPEMRQVRVFIEAEAGSNLRHVYDETTFELSSSRRLPAAYPFSYGFIVGTKTDDGGAIDCYMLATQPITAGRLVDGELVGLLEQFEDGVPDHKLLAVLPGTSQTLDPSARQTLDRFIRKVFQRYPSVKVEVGRLLGTDAARRYVDSHRTSGREEADEPRPAANGDGGVST